MIDMLTGQPFYLTLKVSFLSVLLQIIFGIPLGLYIAGKKSFLRQITEILVTLPMIFPPMALGFFLLLVLGKKGVVGKFLIETFDFKIIFTFTGVLISVFLVGLPFMVKSIQSARQQMDESIVEAARTLGKSKFKVISRIIIPNIKKGIITGLLLAFGRSLGEVGISLMLGGNIIGRTETLSLAIYNAVYEGNFKIAAQYSVLLSVLTIIVLLVLNSGNYKQIIISAIKKNRMKKISSGINI